MTPGERLALGLLHRLEPERAHALSLAALRRGLVAGPGPVTSARLATRLAGLELPNPVGLAAGYDKDAVAIDPLLRAGFGFVEVGAATPLPQPGNPAPRLFRLPEDRAVINRMGFNNAGAEAIAARLAARRRRGVVGINLGAGRASADPVGDFVRVLTLCGPHVDFATVNVSSPNTTGLRGLQAGPALAGVLERVQAARDALPRRIPLFVKISPDLEPGELAQLAEVAQVARIDAIVATNTTVSREALRAAARAEPGGLSGQPLAARARATLARLYLLTGGRVPLVGVGGIGSAEDAYARIRAGASAVQLYTALVYEGMSLVPRVVRGLEALLARDGFAAVADAVGADAEQEERAWRM